jgi:CO/xanthine dehydrogenase FAD-binding subunit
MRQAAIGAAGVGAILLTLAGVENWSMGQPSTRSEVSQVVAKLTPACRPILQTRFKQKIVQEGRPLTRREVDGLADGIRDCDRIDQQVSGLNDG